MFGLKKWIKAVLGMLALSGGFVGSTQAASVLTLAEADGWSTMGGRNDQRPNVCTMQTAGGNGRWLGIKYFGVDDPGS